MVKTPQLKEITPEQAELVQTDWSYIKNQAVDILENFFEKHPGNMKKFKAFAGKSLEDAKELPEFELHASAIANALGSVIELLGKDLQGIKDIVNTIGNSHREKEISKFSFLEFREAFFDFLRFSCGGSVEGMTAWNDTVDLIYHIIFNNLDGTPV